MDRLQEMATFVAVVEAGSFIGAADASGLTKAAASRHVAALEQRLGARLLHRTTRRLSLTDEGQRFYAQAKDLLASLEEIENEAASRTADAVGRLRINAPLTFGVMHLAPLWTRFIDQNPKVSLDVSLNDRVVDLIEEGYDLAVRITNLTPSQLVSRPLAITRMVTCAAPAYLRKHAAPVHPQDLLAHRVVSYSYWQTGDEWTFAGPEGEVSVRTRPFLHSNNGDTCRALALAGEAIILQPDFLVGADLRRGDLVEVMPSYRCIQIGIHAVYPSRKHLAVKTRRMVDFLVQAFQTPPWR